MYFKYKNPDKLTDHKQNTGRDSEECEAGGEVMVLRVRVCEHGYDRAVRRAEHETRTPKAEVVHELLHPDHERDDHDGDQRHRVHRQQVQYRRHQASTRPLLRVLPRDGDRGREQRVQPFRITVRLDWPWHLPRSGVDDSTKTFLFRIRPGYIHLRIYHRCIPFIILFF